MRGVHQGEQVVCCLCGSARGVSARRCPADYCHTRAFCHHCESESPKSHEGCFQLVARAAARSAREDALLAAGEFVRKSALGVGAGPDRKVHVLFKNGAGKDKGFYMSTETYRVFDLLEPVTPAMFQKHGTLTDAPPNYV